MFKKEKRQALLIKLFVVSSLVAFFVFIFCFYFFYASLKYSDTATDESAASRQAKGDSHYYFDKSNKHKDPYTTMVPKLEDYIKGPIISGSDPSFGNINSPLNLVIYSDFECNYCANQEKVLKDIVGEYDARLIWKDYPVNDPASKSYQAAMAARCAMKENAFWGFHDLLYSHQYGFDMAGFRSIAEKLNMDTEDFDRCMQSKAPAKEIEDDIREAEALDISGIPFLYVNDKEIMGNVSKEELKQTIDAVLNNKK